MEQDTELKKSTYIIYAILFVLILILVGVTVTFAYYGAQTTDSTTTNVSFSADCFDISYSEENTINLDFNYPITDEYALANVTPVTIKVTNNCTNNLENVDYTLAITSLSNAEGYITNDKIRTNVTRTIESESTFLPAKYLSDLKPLEIGYAYTNLNNDLDIRDGISDYTNRTSYVIDSSNISNGTTIIYNVYLWVDYYEGDKEAYNGAEHDESYDNTTEGQQFAAAISLLVNNKVAVDHRLPDEYQEVEYLESDGNQYLEIDFKADQLTKSKAKFQITDTTVAKALFGARSNASINFYGFNWGGGTPYIYYNSYYSGLGTTTYIDDEIHTLYKDQKVLYIDDKPINTHTTTVTTFTTPYNLIVFGLNNNGTVDLLSKAKIFYLQFIENDILQIDLIPCYRKSDGIAGMYDLVNNTFYTNEGTGEFTVGHNVS